MRLFRYLFLGISLFMVGVAVWASSKSDLFAEGARLLKEPWMAATLIDFYFNIFIIACWVFYREKNKAIAVLWGVSFIFLGSIGTAFYVFLVLCRIARGESAKTALLGLSA